MIDIGANLTSREFAHDVGAVIDRARMSGLEHIIVTGTDDKTSLDAALLAANHNGFLSSTAGIHPHHADHADENSLAAVERLLDMRNVVAVGETGLDYFRNFATHDNQQRIFRAQIELALAKGVPLFVHDRETAGDVWKCLREMGANDVVIHCFTGSEHELEKYLELDYYIGITGWICDERRGMAIRELVGRIPKNRLLIETDAPYLLPRTIRPRPKKRRNEPSNLRYVAECVAEARQESIEEVCTNTTANARRLFRLRNLQ